MIKKLLKRLVKTKLNLPLSKRYEALMTQDNYIVHPHFCNPLWVKRDINKIGQ